MSNRDILKNGLKNLGISVDDKMLNDFNIYREILVDWNQKMNLTGIEDEKEVYIKHFLDSVSAVTNGYIKDGVSIIDVGTGAGFPGLPLRICLRNIELTLLDSLNKRINFLQEVSKQVGIDNIEFIHGRAEDFGKLEEYREKYDIATARAVAGLPILMEFCVPFVKVGGRCICMKSFEIEEELKAGNEFNLSTEEKAFFDALGDDPEVKELMKDEILVQIAKELVETVNSNMTIDWDIRKDARAKMRIEIKKLLIKYNYPPNKSEKAVQTVIRQAELKCKEMIG